MLMRLMARNLMEPEELVKVREGAEWRASLLSLEAGGQRWPVGVVEKPVAEGVSGAAKGGWKVLYGKEWVAACYELGIEVVCFVYPHEPKRELVELVETVIELLENPRANPVAKARAIRRLHEGMVEEFGEAWDKEMTAMVLGVPVGYVMDMLALSLSPITEAEAQGLSLMQIRALVEEERELKLALKLRGRAKKPKLVLVEDLGGLEDEYPRPMVVFVDYGWSRSMGEVLKVVDRCTHQSGMVFVLEPEFEKVWDWMEELRQRGWVVLERPIVRVKAGMGPQVDGPCFPARCCEWVVQAVRPNCLELGIELVRKGQPDWLDAPVLREKDRRHADLRLWKALVGFFCRAEWKVAGLWLRNLSFAYVCEALGQEVALCHYDSVLVEQKHREVWGDVSVQGLRSRSGRHAEAHTRFVAEILPASGADEGGHADSGEAPQVGQAREDD